MRQKTSPIWTSSTSEFAKLVTQSTTYAEILRHYNLATRGDNYRTLKNRIEHDGLSIEHFTPNKARVVNLHKKLPIEELLVQNSTFSRNNLKRRLIEEKIIAYECRSCGNKGTWNGKKMSLQLEHMNGVPDDNRIHNLCFLCPNCHSQTETYAGKKNKVIHMCTTCEEPIKGTGVTGQCSLCLGKTRRKAERPSKEVLQASVDTIGYSATGRQYGVSDNAIRKWLK